MSGTAMCRIDTDEKGLDDLAISGELIEMLRLERMADNHFWGRVYMRDGNHIELGIYAKRQRISIDADRPTPSPTHETGGRDD